jgi:hypothetical protein
MRDSSEFVARLRTLAENFARARNIPSTVIRVWTAQDAYDVAAAGAGPLDGFLTLDVYPDDPDDMVAGTDGASLTPRQVILPIGAITRIELLAERPREHAIGFAAEVDPTAAP